MMMLMLVRRVHEQQVRPVLLPVVLFACKGTLAHATHMPNLRQLATFRCPENSTTDSN